MKKNLLFVALIILAQCSWGQSISLLNKTVSDKNSKTLYIGIENELTINSESLVSIQPKAGVKVDQNKLTIRPTSVGQLTIVFNTDNSKIPMTFDVKRMPDPIPVIAGQTDRKISKDVLLAENLISLRANNDDPFFVNYDIVSFTVKFKDKTYDITGNKFSTEILSELNSSNIGDTFTINSLVGRNTDVNKTINLRSNYSYTIK